MAWAGAAQALTRRRRRIHVERIPPALLSYPCRTAQVSDCVYEALMALDFCHERRRELASEAVVVTTVAKAAKVLLRTSASARGRLAHGPT